MDEKLKDSLKRSVSELKEMQDRFENWTKDAPDEMQDIREVLEKTLSKIGLKLDESMVHGEKLGEEAQLQAHLAMMEAREKLESSRKVFDQYLDQATDQGKTLMDELELKLELARMEAEDFWEKRGPELSEEFKKSREVMINLADSAMSEMQTQFKKWNTLFNQKKS